MRPNPARRSRPRVAIVGAGFAGLTAAQALGRDCEVTVIDGSAWFEWRPNLHELVSGLKRPADLRLPLARLVRRAGQRYVRATATAVDARRGEVVVSTGRPVPFDACIVAVGGVSTTFGVRGADQHALPFKSVADATAVGRRLVTLAREPGRRSVVIVGGGLEGVEVLGEVLRRFRGRDALEVTLVEAGPRLLAGMPASLDRAVRRHCARLGVRVLTATRVTAATRRRVRLLGGDSLRSDLTIWTAGAAPSPLIAASGLARGRGQWASVTKALQSTRHDNVFVVGDAAALPTPLAKQAYYAMQTGEAAARNVERFLAGRTPRYFRPSPKPMLVAFGDLDTFLVAGRSAIASPAFASAKEAVFQLTMAQIDSPWRPGALQDLSARLSGVLGRWKR